MKFLQKLKQLFFKPKDDLIVWESLLIDENITITVYTKCKTKKEAEEKVKKQFPDIRLLKTVVY